MKTRCMQRLLAVLLITVPVLSWQNKHDDWKKEKCPKDDCPLVKTVCPVFNGSNGFKVTNNGDDENNPTLRAAINAANESNATKCNPFVIVFDLSQAAISEPNVIRIESESELPEIKKPVCIDGFTNPGSSESERVITVTICNDDGVVKNGLVLAPTACGSTIKGLAFVNFDLDDGSAIVVRASCSLVKGNNIGDTNDDQESCDLNRANNNGIMLENTEYVTVGGICRNEQNVISGNNNIGIYIKQSNHITVVGNYIGTDVTGTLARENQNTGIKIEGCDNIIGCKLLCGGNLISGNTDTNIDINGSCNKVVNALIGLDICGKRPLGSQKGVSIDGTYNSVSKSVIAGNSSTNVEINGSFNTVRCSKIGTDPWGRTAFASDLGVVVGNDGAEATRAVGTSSLATNNVIKENLITVRLGTGILINRASNTVICKNRIGTDCKEKCPLGQAIGIDLVSVSCSPAGRKRTENKQTSRYEIPRYAHLAHRAVQPTGTCERPCGECNLEELQEGCCLTPPIPGEAVKTCIKNNLIAGNTCVGIRLTTAARFNTIEKNFIGVNKKCHFIPNGYGIFAQDGAQSNTITKNVIAGNRFNGIGIQGVFLEFPVEFFTQTINNSITKNAIFGNCGSGIRLLAGGNDCLGAPLITEAIVCDEHVDVTIDPASLPEAPFTVELYANKKCRKCVSEGQVFLCCKTVTEDVVDPIILRAKVPCPGLKFVTATVTKLTKCFATGNTSEFSCPVKLVPCVLEEETTNREKSVESDKDSVELRSERDEYFAELFEALVSE